MRNAFAAAFVAAFLVACGGGGNDGTVHLCAGADTTPASTDPDYASNFVGTWVGTVTITLDGQSDSGASATTISRTSANKLGFADAFVGSVGLVTTPLTADLACMTGTQGESCGSVTMTFSEGGVTLSEDLAYLNLAWNVTAEGCGQYLTGTVTMDNAMQVPTVRSGDAAAAQSAESIADMVAKRIAARAAR
jgi:hypothetical protein